jgi:hypothetical protein
MQPQAITTQIQEIISGEKMYLFNLNLTNTIGINLARYLDIRATQHMMHDKKLLDEFRALAIPFEVYLHDDSVREVKGFDTTYIFMMIALEK